MQQPRQMYGLGSLVKSVTKGAKKLVSGAVDTVKDVAKSPIGKAAMLYFGGNLLQGNALFGNPFTGRITDFITAKGLPSILGTEKGDLLKNTLKIGAAGTILGGALEGYGTEEEDTTIGGERNVEALRTRLTKAYRELRYPEEQIPALVEADLAEYTSGAGGYAEGGRIGYAMGDRAEDNAIQASGIMNLPLNQNPAGVTELDLRDSGGFIPPVGVKEKADDIPAMLSNNEFVFTADAVRGMGDGDVNKGAQRMYDMMKKLENGGRV